MKNKTWLPWLIVLFTIGLFFHRWLTLRPICSGDCLHFYPKSLESFFDFPFVWDNRGGDSGLGAYTPMFLYMYLPSLMAGFLYRYLQITYNIAEKIIWFFPFLIFSIISLHSLTKVLRLSQIVFILATVFYLLNTYILLVVDGGQVGIALAYAIFPLSLALFIKSLSSGYKSKILAGLAIALLGVFDIRIACLALTAYLLYSLFYLIFEKELLKIKLLQVLSSLAWLALLAVGVHFYWLLPTIIGGKLITLNLLGINPEDVERLSWMNLNHLFFVFQPHWPQNVFGKLSPIRFEFFLVPIFVFMPLIFRRISYQTLYFVCLALVFLFLGKGFQNPLSNIYQFLFYRVPGFNVFRDPTKFLIPQLTAYAILLGMTIQVIYQFLKPYKKIASFFLGLSFVYILVLVRPVFYPGLSGTFRPMAIPSKYLAVKNELEQDSSYYRTIWYPDKDHFSYRDQNHPAISAREDLRNIRPLNVFITGTYDLFSYLKNSFSEQIFDILGIRYLYVVDPLKKSFLTKTDMEGRQRLEKDLAAAVWLKRQDGDGLLAFENFSYSPRIFTQNKTFWVVGSDDLYRSFSDYLPFRLRDIGFVFLDEGETNKKIHEMRKEKDLLVYNQKGRMDLAFLLVDWSYFYSATSYIDKQGGTGGWGKSGSEELVFWRDILENRGFRNLDFDLGKGFIWADTPANILFPIDVDRSQDYEIYLRFFANDRGSDLKVIFDENQYELKTKSPLNNFIWQRLGELSLVSGSHQLGFVSEKGFNVINAVVVAPKGEIARKIQEAEMIERDCEVIYVFNFEQSLGRLEKSIKPGKYRLLIYHSASASPADLRINGRRVQVGSDQWSETASLELGRDNQLAVENIDRLILYPARYNSFADFFNQASPEVSFEYVNPTRYRVKIEPAELPYMLVFSENFNQFWQFRTKSQVFHSVPLYSTLNGFNLPPSERVEGEIVFSLQKYIYPGMLVSILVLAAAIISYFADFMGKRTFKVLLFIIWLMMLFVFKKFTSLSGFLFGKSLFFSLWAPFVIIFGIPYQISLSLGVLLLVTFPIFYFSDQLGQGERVVIYAWGFLVVALCQKLMKVFVIGKKNEPKG